MYVSGHFFLIYKLNTPLSGLVESLENEKATLDRSDLSAFVSFHDRIISVLHSDHGLVNSTRRWIVPFYCRPTRRCPDLWVTNEMLEKKVEMCRGLIRVLDKVERGLTIDRGECLLVLYICLIRVSFNKISRQGNFFE